MSQIAKRVSGRKSGNFDFDKVTDQEADAEKAAILAEVGGSAAQFADQMLTTNVAAEEKIR